MGKAQVAYEKEEDITSYKEAFPGLSFADDELPEEEITTKETIYIWDVSVNLYNVYRITKNYVINEFYSLDSTILISLIKEMALPLAESLELIPFLHNGYVEILIEHREKTNGSTEDS